MSLNQFFKKLQLFVYLLAYLSSNAQDPTKPPGKNFDLSAWKLQTLSETDQSFLEITNSSQLEVYTSYFFYTDSFDGSMVLKCPSNGGTTSAGTKYPRVELRQLGDGANWSLSDRNEHYLAAQCKVLDVAQVKPQTIIGQIHGSEKNSEMLKLRWTGYQPGECFIEARFQTNDNEGSEYGVKLAEGLSLGDMIEYTITMKEGLVNVTINGNSASQKYTSQFYGTSDRYYFKSGNYIQWNDDIVSAPPSVTGITKFYRLSLKKSILTSIPSIASLPSTINIYPNPAIDYIVIETDLFDNENISIRILDIRGKIISQVHQVSDSFAARKLRLDINELISGIYYILLSTEKHAETQKLLILR